MKTWKEGKLSIWNKNHRMSSSFMMMKNHRRKTSLRRRSDKTEVLKHGEMYHIGGKMKMKMIKNNDDNYNNRLICSSPILKRHKIMMDEDLIGMEESSSRTTTTICDLCEVVLTEVLVRLSIKDLWACVCVQKSWLSLVKSPIFITLYSNYRNQKNISSSNNNNNKYLLFRNNYSEWDGEYEIRLDDIECEKYLTPRFPPHLGEHSSVFPKLVSNGLICTFEDTDDTDHPIYLWNPLIQKCKTLPNSPHLPCTLEVPMWKAIAFGFLPQIDDYLVVYIVKHGLWDKPHTHYIITCVYSLNTNSWRKITHNNLPHVSRLDYCDSFFVNGVAVWGGLNSQKKKIVMCFDTKTDVLREILLPKCADAPNNLPTIHPFGQSLVYFSTHKFYYNKVGMWVSKGDLMNEVVWEKKVTVKFENFVRAHVLGLRNNGDPILCNSYDMISYNLDNYKSYDFVTSWDSWTPYRTCWDGRTDKMGRPFDIYPFVESLVLLDTD